MKLKLSMVYDGAVSQCTCNSGVETFENKMAEAWEPDCGACGACVARGGWREVEGKAKQIDCGSKLVQPLTGQ